MKKIIIINLTVLFLTCSFAGSPQIPNTTAKLNVNSLLKERINPSEQSVNSLLEAITPVSIAEINAKAVRNFSKDYKKATDVKWIKTSEGLYAAYFVNDDIQNLVCYNKKGNFECQLRYYQEEKLPREIRGLVKSAYYDFSIYLVTEVHRNGKIAYVIKMEDKTSWKTVKVVDGEMEVTEDYRKSK